MQTRALLKYFLFLRSHWNLRLAIFTIRHEISGEKKYGIETLGVDDLKNTDVKSDNKKHAYIYQPASYFLLEKIFDFLNTDFDKSGFVDYGCGKGRVMAVAAFNGYKNITGIDFSKQLCEAAIKNTDKIKDYFLATNFKTLCIDATEYEIKKEDTTFFFFNPFDEVIMLQVVKNILASQKNFQGKL
jgi:SAM-dependent methyltransferase